LPIPSRVQLTGAQSTKAPQKGAIAAALDVCPRSRLSACGDIRTCFLEEVAHDLGINPDALPAIPEFAQTADLAGTLRRLRRRRFLIEQDLEIIATSDRALTGALDEGSKRPLKG